MSSSSSLFTGAGAPAPQLYFCHQCNRTVSVTPTPSSDVLCPTCHGGFIEEYQNPNPNPNPQFPFLPFDDQSPFSSAFPLLFSRSAAPIAGFASGSGSTGGFQNPNDLSALFGGPVSRTTVSVQNPGEFNPFAFLQNYLTTLRAGGANIQFVIENDTGGGGGGDGIRIPGNFGDYFLGPGLEQLIQQLAENDPNRHGPPPASKTAVEKLPNVRVGKELLESDSSDCAVCKDGFKLDEEVKQLPCKHMYHSDCILPWLELHNSCPVCRFELPTDDPDYERRARARQTSGGGGGGGGDNASTPRSGERRFRINLPWSFMGYGPSSAEGSNSGSGNSSSGDGNQGSGGGGHAARQEDLD